MKELFLLRGLPGSGKSTLANSLVGAWVEADHYFIDTNGNYNFEANKIRNAHEFCQAKTENWMSNNFPFPRIIVSNTFTQEKELEPYYQLAEKYGYTVFSLVVENRHGESEDTNTHNVPKETIQKMRDRFQIKL
jgi:predicted kinase